MKKMLMPLLVMVLLLTACGGGGFNADTAAKESKKTLKAFFALYDNREALASLKNEDIKKVINKKMTSYFTDNFKNDVYQAIEKRNTYFQNEAVFFLTANKKGEKTLFRSDFTITNFRVKKDKEKVLLRIDADERTLGAYRLKIEMVMVEGKWKINQAS